MDKNTLEQLFSLIPGCSVGILGDFCVDAYWELHPELGEHSIETGLVTTPVGAARYSPGGAGNIAANLRGLEMERIFCFGALGLDPFGNWLRHTLYPGWKEGDKLLRIEREEYHTPVYCKPMLNGCEQSRMDIGGVAMTEEESERLLDLLERSIPSLNVLIINQQLHCGVHSEHFRKRFAALLKRAAGSLRVVFDGREHLDAYPGVTLKINASAASQLAFGHHEAPPEESGAAILRRTGDEMVVTDGSKGCYVFEHRGTTFIPAIHYSGPVDTVGAGDSFTAGFALALACGFPMTKSAEFGNACAGLTIRKLAQTGVPTRGELLELFP